jgi:hypothetical protein
MFSSFTFQDVRGWMFAERITLQGFAEKSDSEDGFRRYLFIRGNHEPTKDNWAPIIAGLNTLYAKPLPAITLPAGRIRN